MLVCLTKMSNESTVLTLLFAFQCEICLTLCNDNIFNFRNTTTLSYLGGWDLIITFIKSSEISENLVKKDISELGNDIGKRLEDISFDVTAVSMQFGQQKFQ